MGKFTQSVLKIDSTASKHETGSITKDNSNTNFDISFDEMPNVFIFYKKEYSIPTGKALNIAQVILIDMTPYPYNGTLNYRVIGNRSYINGTGNALTSSQIAAYANGSGSSNNDVAKWVDFDNNKIHIISYSTSYYFDGEYVWEAYWLEK